MCVCVCTTVFDDDDKEQRPGLIKHTKKGEENSSTKERRNEYDDVDIINIIKERHSRSRPRVNQQ